jgi:hypothetical protein
MKNARLALEGESSLYGESRINLMQVASHQSPFCSYGITTGTSTATMQGTITESNSGQEVTINFNYGPLSDVTPATCTVPLIGTRSGDPSWTGTPPVAALTSATFPAKGGTKRYVLGNGGRLTITLKPIVEQGN